MSFGEKIRELREKRGLSQQELANSINRLCNTHLKRNTISNYERNKSFPDYCKLTAIVSILDTSSDNLLGLASKRQHTRQTSSSRNRETYTNSIEEPTGKGNLDSATIGSGYSPIFRKVKYVLANEHNTYSKNCKKPDYIENLPSFSIPYTGHHTIRAFQLPAIPFPALPHNKLKGGDIVIGEQVSYAETDPSIPYYLVVWKDVGLKVLRYHELIQFIELPDLVEIWQSGALINYKVPGNPDTDQ